MVTEQSMDSTKGDRDFQPSMSESPNDDKQLNETRRDRTTPKREVLKSRLAEIIERYGNQLMRHASTDTHTVTGSITDSTRKG